MTWSERKHWTSIPACLDLSGDDPVAVDLRKIEVALRFLTTNKEQEK